MFGIGFWEIVVIGVIALLVVGPEKFPGLVKNVAFWLGRFREMATNVKQEFKQEVDRAEQLQKLVEDQQDILRRHNLLDDSKLTVPIQGRPATPVPAVIEPPVASVSSQVAFGAASPGVTATDVPSVKSNSIVAPLPTSGRE